MWVQLRSYLKKLFAMGSAFAQELCEIPSPEEHRISRGFHMLLARKDFCRKKTAREL